MFKHIVIEYSNNGDEEESDDDDDDNSSVEANNEIESDVDRIETVEEVFVEIINEDIMEEAEEIETVEFTIFVPCRDHWLSKDQVFYTDELRKFREIERIENLWIHSKNNYEVGTYLQADLKFQTRFSSKFNNNVSFRQSIWNRLGINDTCPDQGEKKMTDSWALWKIDSHV